MVIVAVGRCGVGQLVHLAGQRQHHRVARFGEENTVVLEPFRRVTVLHFAYSADDDHRCVQRYIGFRPCGWQDVFVHPFVNVTPHHQRIRWEPIPPIRCQDMAFDIVETHSVTERVRKEVPILRTLGDGRNEPVPVPFVHKDDFVMPTECQMERQQGQPLVPTEHVRKVGWLLGPGQGGQHRLFVFRRHTPTTPVIPSVRWSVVLEHFGNGRIDRDPHRGIGTVDIVGFVVEGWGGGVGGWGVKEEGVQGGG